MNLRERLLDAIIDGKIGRGILISRQEFMNFFSDVNPLTSGCFLSNSEIHSGVMHSPTYTHFTIRVSNGMYRIHPLEIGRRMAERGLI